MALQIAKPASLCPSRDVLTGVGVLVPLWVETIGNPCKFDRYLNVRANGIRLKGQISHLIAFVPRCQGKGAGWDMPLAK